MTPRCVLQHHWALFSFVYKFVGPFGGSVDFQADAFAAARALAEGRDPYLALLEEERQQQLDKMLHAIESEMARLEDLRAHHAKDGGHLIDWLDREIDDLESRHAWLEAKRTEV